MTVELLQEILATLPPEMEVLIKLEDGSLIDLCHNYEVAPVDFYLPEAHHSGNMQDDFLILQPCACTPKYLEPGSKNSKPELN